MKKYLFLLLLCCVGCKSFDEQAAKHDIKVLKDETWELRARLQSRHSDITREHDISFKEKSDLRDELSKLKNDMNKKILDALNETEDWKNKYYELKYSNPEGKQ